MALKSRSWGEEQTQQMYTAWVSIRPPNMYPVHQTKGRYTYSQLEVTSVHLRGWTREPTLTGNLSPWMSERPPRIKQVQFQTQRVSSAFSAASSRNISAQSGALRNAALKTLMWSARSKIKISYQSPWRVTTTRPNSTSRLVGNAWTKPKGLS